jgi:hypothetical protein
MASLEKRVEILESKLAELLADAPRRDKDWRRAVAKYAGDEGLQAVFKEAMKLREADRRRARAGQRQKRGKQG